MELSALLESFKNCECGEEHSVDIKDIVIEHGVKDRAGALIRKYTDKNKIFMVSDKNAIKASVGILKSLESEGFLVKADIYDNICVADMKEVDAVASACADRALSGSGRGILLCKRWDTIKYILESKK